MRGCRCISSRRVVSGLPKRGASKAEAIETVEVEVIVSAKRPHNDVAGSRQQQLSFAQLAWRVIDRLINLKLPPLATRYFWPKVARSLKGPSDFCFGGPIYWFSKSSDRERTTTTSGAEI